ncbi:hypothetical protein D3C81_1883740 [compost metagenome]
MQAYLNHFYALIGEGFPDNAVGRKLLIADDNLVAGLPSQAEGDERKGLRCVFDQCDVIRRRRVRQSHQAFAKALLHLHPVWIVPGAQQNVLFGKAAHRVRAAFWPRSDRRMV